MQIQKRDGRLEAYDENKIYKAIMGAVGDLGIEVNEDIVKRIVKDITQHFEKEEKEYIPIEDIQDIV